MKPHSTAMRLKWPDSIKCESKIVKYLDTPMCVCVKWLDSIAVCVCKMAEYTDELVK